MSETISLSTALATKVVNEFDYMGEEIINVLRTNLTGMTGYYGYKPFGAYPDISYPCFMVEPISQKPMMVTTGKYEIHLNFQVYFFVQESSSDSIIRLQTYVAEAMTELFTNAFYKSHPPYWINSEVSEVYLSGNFKNATPQGTTQYMRAGRLTLDLMDVVIK
jgi:hypothetical protein